MKDCYLVYIDGLKDKNGNKKGEVLLGFPYAPREVDCFEYEGVMYKKAKLTTPGAEYDYPKMTVIVITSFVPESEVMVIQNQKEPCRIPANNVAQGPYPSAQAPQGQRPL